MDDKINATMLCHAYNERLVPIFDSIYKLKVFYLPKYKMFSALLNRLLNELDIVLYKYFNKPSAVIDRRSIENKSDDLSDNDYESLLNELKKLSVETLLDLCKCLNKFYPDFDDPFNLSHLEVGKFYFSLVKEVVFSFKKLDTDFPKHESADFIELGGKLAKYLLNVKENFSLALELEEYMTLNIKKSLLLLKSSDSLTFTNETVASRHRNVGKCYMGLGQFEKAVYFGLRAMRIYSNMRCANRKENDLKVASCLFDIAVCYMKEGSYKQALEYHKRALDLRVPNGFMVDVNKIVLDLKGVTERDIGDSFLQIGNCFKCMGVETEAGVYLNRALELKKMVYINAGNHPEIAECYFSIGEFYSFFGDHYKAIECLDLSLEILYKYFGTENKYSVIGRTMSSIGACYLRLNKLGSNVYLDKALKYYEDALKINDECYDFDHSSFGDMFYSMAKVCEKLGDLVSAIEFTKKCVSVRAELLQEDNVDLYCAYKQLIGLLKKKSENVRALEYEQKLKAIEFSIFRKKVNCELEKNLEECFIDYLNSGSSLDKFIESDFRLAK